jgi:hypothetical protein
MVASHGQRTVIGRGHGDAESGIYRGFSRVDPLIDYRHVGVAAASRARVDSGVGHPAKGTDARGTFSAASK